MSEFFIMNIGDGEQERIEGDVYRENDTEIHVKMMNGSEAILPKGRIVERGQMTRRS